jgi:hypothetical protein
VCSDGGDVMVLAKVVKVAVEGVVEKVVLKRVASVAQARDS